MRNICVPLECLKWFCRICWFINPFCVDSKLLQWDKRKDYPTVWQLSRSRLICHPRLHKSGNSGGFLYWRCIAYYDRKCVISFWISYDEFSCYVITFCDIVCYRYFCWVWCFYTCINSDCRLIILCNNKPNLYYVHFL